jgi:hypothetical protein
MRTTDIVNSRLRNQQITNTAFKKPAEIVNWMIAMQAQEYAMAKWAIGLRLPGTKDVDVEKAFNAGEILRTHLMRPTWHFVSPEDIRWLLQLTAPRVNTANAFMYRKLELDDKIFKRTNIILTKALEGKKQLTRTQLQEVLKQKKIVADGLRLVYIMMRAELDGIICSGARAGKQFSYALLEERVPATKPISREQALVSFTRRYFTSRGPATIQDFAYWSGLTIKDAKEGAASLPPDFEKTTVNEKEYIFIPGKTDPYKKRRTFLMPDYDEYGMSYKDRSALSSPAFRLDKTDPYSHWLVVEGLIEGTWSPIKEKKETVAEAAPFIKLSKLKAMAVARAIKEYNYFNG